LSPYQHGIKEKLEISDDKIEKLVPSLGEKVGYVCDIRNLKYYEKKGLKITKVHAVLTFDQRRWMAKYINYNTTRRGMAKDEAPGLLVRPTRSHATAQVGEYVEVSPASRREIVDQVGCRPYLKDGNMDESSLRENSLKL
jgi:hypothetical protein